MCENRLYIDEGNVFLNGVKLKKCKNVQYKFDIELEMSNGDTVKIIPDQNYCLFPLSLYSYNVLSKYR
jgi:hypothetical protein